MSVNGMDLQLVTKTYFGEVNFFDSQVMRFIRGGATVDSTKVSAGYNVTENQYTRKIVPAGTFFAKVGTTGKVAPAKYAALKTTTLTTDTEIELVDARPFVVGDKITIGSAAQATISAVDYATNKITIGAIGTAVTAGAECVGDSCTEVVFLGTEAVELTLGDAVTTGVDDARVIAARLPIAPTATIKTKLAHITFVA